MSDASRNQFAGQYGQALRDRRRKLGFSAQQLADAIGQGWHRNTISRWESGQSLPDVFESKLLSQFFRAMEDAAKY